MKKILWLVLVVTLLVAAAPMQDAINGYLVCKNRNVDTEDCLTIWNGGNISVYKNPGNTSVFSVDGENGNTVIAGTLTQTGIQTNAALLNANGGIAVDTSNFTVSGTTGNVGGTGTLSLTPTSAATSANGANFSITQSDAVTMTGTLRGGYFVATNGQIAASGTIRGIEAKARAANSSNVGANVTTLEGASIDADSKTKNVTLMRGAEVILDGASGTVTTAVGVEIDNNSSGTQTTSYGLSINQGTASGHKVFTSDIRLQQGETIDNATDGVVKVTGNFISTGVQTEVNATDTISVTSAYYGKTVFLTHADAVAVTIAPSAPAGATVTFVLNGDDNLAVTFSVDGGTDNLIAPNNATADSVTFGSGHRIGAVVKFLSNGTSWIAINQNAGCTMTVTDGA